MLRGVSTACPQAPAAATTAISAASMVDRARHVVKALEACVRPATEPLAAQAGEAGGPAF
jgi:hypothetical protein